MKILNLYAGIGGNRKLWPLKPEDKVTAIEWDPERAAVYKKLFPQDEVIETDAHQYLLDHYKEYDFIWSSPPCPTHSRANNYLNAQGCIRYPEMALYQEIIFLKHFFKGQWVVENVISYYDPLIKPQELDRHYFWTNFILFGKENYIGKGFDLLNNMADNRQKLDDYLQSLQEYLGINLDEFDTAKSKKVDFLRNCVKPRTGLFVWKCAFKEKQQTLEI